MLETNYNSKVRAVVVWPVQLRFVYAGVSTSLAKFGSRHGWRNGRSGMGNVLGHIFLIPGILDLRLIAFHHLAH